jgi:queuine tRNA-ribosyltransferase
MTQVMDNGAAPTTRQATRYPGFAFDVLARDAGTRARLGLLDTPHGELMTPAFIFCATKAAIKAASPRDLRAVNADIILANTYHMMIQPGADTVQRMGGLHAFCGWDGPMLTDSGGFQIFSLGLGGSGGGASNEIKNSRHDKRTPLLTKLTEDGATFRSPRDGAYHTLTPEASIDIQRKLGADMIVVLDECTPFHVDRDYTARSLAMTHRWADRCLAAFERGHDGRQALYGVIQGGVYEDLRREGAEFVASRPFFGHAVGGCLGDHKDQLYDIVGYSMSPAPEDRPVHLLGIGGIRDIWEGVALGIDTFDCVTPTRIARHGWALKRQAEAHRINLRNARFAEDREPLDPECACPSCSGFSRGYIHHLLKAGEILGIQLLTVHNMAFMTRLMATIRSALLAGRFAEAKRDWFA